ncbi:hypothetical protein PI23P_07110 [Polaribacter irgensii 23-P]|uniref:Secreted protein n=1 Tax=Polaribacter irgensii 23-P TaxID=313594 RepID=A4BYY1_9FLAO|nr:hypothetical protein [Polaribacter irgensii]EAR12374.1 hypothetical protein PI23P_07110 [Polaribacter irgensii 23-P]
MTQKNKTFIFLIFILSTTNFIAQLDKNKGAADTGAIKSIVLKNAKVTEKPTSILLNGNNGFKDAYNQEQETLKKQQDEDALNNKGIISQKQVSEARFLKAFKKINGQYIYPVIDQDLGSFRTNSGSVNIICRDFQYPDGDRVTILLNNIPVIVNIVLEERYQSFTIPLEIGINKIAFVALNQGTSGPNTAAFKVYNDAGALLSANEWNLATDAKATIIIAKDK